MSTELPHEVPPSPLFRLSPAPGPLATVHYEVPGITMIASFAMGPKLASATGYVDEDRTSTTFVVLHRTDMEPHTDTDGTLVAQLVEIAVARIIRIDHLPRPRRVPVGGA